MASSLVMSTNIYVSSTAIDKLCNQIIQCCLEAGAQCIPSHIVTDKAVAGWNDHVKQARE